MSDLSNIPVFDRDLGTLLPLIAGTLLASSPNRGIPPIIRRTIRVLGGEALGLLCLIDSCVKII